MPKELQNRITVKQWFHYSGYVQILSHVGFTKKALQGCDVPLSLAKNIWLNCLSFLDTVSQIMDS